LANVTHSRATSVEAQSHAADHRSAVLEIPAENLAIMFTDIVGFTAKTARQSREQNARMMAEHDRLLFPIVRAFSGRRIKSIGDALLVTFRSPTNAVLCAMAIQDRLAIRNSKLLAEDQIVLRVSINIGEVRVQHGDVFGEPVNVASRLESKTPPGEVWLTEAVYLSMNKSEVHAEEVDRFEFKGVPDPVRVYRVPRSGGALPFGGAALGTVGRANPIVTAVVSIAASLRRMREASALWPSASSAWRTEFRRGLRSRFALAIAFTSIALVVGLAWYTQRRSSPIARAQRALGVGAAQQALRELAGAEQGAEADVVRGRALHALKRGDEGLTYYQSAAQVDPRILARPDVVFDLCEDLGGTRSQDAADLLQRSGDRGVQCVADAARETENHRKRWAAVELLHRMKREDKLDLFDVYVADLKSGNCTMATKAARGLGEMGDRRAIEPLKVAAAQKKLGIFDSCEAPAARAALRRLER
jgi:class 3 adenylate cyclase